MISTHLRRRCRALLTSRSFSTTPGTTGFVFDLDGVLFKGKQIIPGADKAIQHLYDQDKQRPKFPVCFLTNGGGVTEAEKAAELSALLNVSIHERQVVMGHTPMRALAGKFSDVPVLVSGKGDLLNVARTYGFNKAVTVEQLCRAMPSAAPFTTLSPPRTPSPCPVQELGYGGKLAPFQSVMVFTDPVDWAQDLQLITDVVVSQGIPGSRDSTAKGAESSVEIHIGHGDLLWANDFPMPRYGLGAFSIAFQSLFQAYTGAPPSIIHYGKPTPAPFRLVESLLREQLEGREPEKIFMVGDNPAADVRGARNAGSPWVPVLVRTGVFHSDQYNAPHDPADIVATDVLEFVKTVV